MRLRFTRRSALQALTLAGGSLALGCSGGADADQEAESEAIKQGSEVLRRYKKFVIVVMENRSFDHYFGHLSLPKGTKMKNDKGQEVTVGEGRDQVNGFKKADLDAGRYDNPGLKGSDLEGKKVRIFPTTRKDIGDIDHEWEACHKQFNGGQMDGFVRAHQEDLVRLNDGNEETKALCFGFEDKKGIVRCADPAEPMAFYTRQDTPIYHHLIDEYALCDAWFASVMGPTWPNRFYLHAATSDGEKANSSLGGIKHRDAHMSTIFSKVDRANKNILKELGDTAKELDPCRMAVSFYTDLPLLPIMFKTAASATCGLSSIHLTPNFNFAPVFDSPRRCGLEGLQGKASKIAGGLIPDALVNELQKLRRDHLSFETMAEQGKLPPVSYIEPPYQLAPGDDHPPHDIAMGQAFIASIYDILKKSPEWEHTLLIVTYDEHGSFYDHQKPGQIAQEENPEFKQLGFRVPALVIGKGVKQNFVSKVQYDHCSALATFTNRFGLEPSNARVENARDVSDCIDANGRGAKGDLELPKVDICEGRVLASAKMAPGQKEIVDQMFGGNVPYEAKKVFTDGILQVFDRRGIVNIKA